MLIAGEDAYRYQLLAGHRLRQRIGRLIETPWDVIELETFKLVLQLVDFSAICSHLGVVAA